MVRYDIITGIKNAVERGASIEQARVSMINAGYNIQEVNEAINYLTGGISQSNTFNPSQIPQVNTKDQNQQVPQKNFPQLPRTTTQQYDSVIQNQNSFSNQPPTNQNLQTHKEAQPVKQKKPFPWVTILLVCILILLLLSLGLVVIFRDQVTTFIQNLVT